MFSTWLFSKRLFNKRWLRLRPITSLGCRGLGLGLGLSFELNLVLDLDLGLGKVSGLFCLLLLFLLLSFFRRLWRGFDHFQNVRLRGAAQARELAFGVRRGRIQPGLAPDAAFRWIS